MDPACPPMPEALPRTVAAFRNGEGLHWLHRLPGIVARCAERWDLSLHTPFPYPSLSYVAPATRADGSRVVLKIGFLHHELALEAAALRIFDGRGAVRLLDADEERGALLLEQLQPGSALELVRDDSQAIGIGAALLRQMWRPAPPCHPFPTLAGWVADLAQLRDHFGGTTGPLPPKLVERAEGLAADLLASAPAPTLLHGDFHHYNILQAQRQAWLTIDPKGVVGDPAFEVGPFLTNRCIGAPDPRRTLARGIDQFSEELGLDRSRVLGWALVHALLSAWWGIEDSGEGWEEAAQRASWLASIPF